jgi:hypothetical protein
MNIGLIEMFHTFPKIVPRYLVREGQWYHLIAVSTNHKVKHYPYVVGRAGPMIRKESILPTKDVNKKEIAMTTQKTEGVDNVQKERE